MPRVLEYTPSWLYRPSEGYNLFAANSAAQSKGSGKVTTIPNGIGSDADEYLGATRTMARRGTQVFVVVGNSIRWSDLCMLQEEHGQGVHGQLDSKASTTDKLSKGSPESDTKGYRLLEVGVHEQIRQLVISPKEDYLAILTAHTVHVAILPDSSHLGNGDTRAIRLRSHTIGSTTHVLSQSLVVEALWHPLGVGGNCLVTVTAEAVVRLWELDRSNRLSYDKPSLAFDLKKLAYGRFAEDDFGAPNDLRKARGFSVDSLDVDVASACFGGRGVDSEAGWSSMTLWVAMKGGDVYALCPLLPSKWIPTSTLLPSLMSGIMAKSEFEPNDSTEEEKMYCDQQYTWLKDVDGQTPLDESGRNVYNRPLLPGSIPKLQGPYYILPDEVGEELSISGIHVIPARLDSDQLMSGEEEQVEDSPGLSCSMICIATRDCTVYLALDLEGVEAKWLPSKKLMPHYSPSPTFQPELVLLEVLETRKPQSSQQDWPSFSPDLNSPYSFFLTHSQGVFFFSCDTWLSTLEDELQNPETEGAAVRLESLDKLPGTLRERIFDLSSKLSNSNMVNNNNSVPAAIIFDDADLGYFLLTSVNGLPQAALLDATGPIEDEPYIKEEDEEYFHLPRLDLLAPAPSRTPFQPSEVFWKGSALATFLETNKHPRQMNTIKDVVRLSPNTLDLMTKAHRILSHETHRLGIAASDMFVRIESLQVQLQDQIRKAREVRDLIQDLGSDNGPRSRNHDGLFTRIEGSRDKQRDLNRRCEALKRRANNVGARDFSDKERGFAKEVDRMAKSILDERDADEMGGEDERHETDEGEVKWRFAEATNLASSLIAQSNELTSSSPPNGDAPKARRIGSSPAFQIPPGIREAKIRQIHSLLDRESALMDATQQRLSKLTL